LAPRKIRVNAISPGHTETEGTATAGIFEGAAGAALAEKTPLGRLGRVTDIAPLAVFLASDESPGLPGKSFALPGASSSRADPSNNNFLHAGALNDHDSTRLLHGVQQFENGS
jgi:NAD(P)-dependent dehydrogenase (short-subunit alcohol dehydrogenase family)